MMLEQLAYLHGTPTARGILKAEAADFVVNEDLGFEPCGEGEHIFVRVRKTGENTAWVAGLLADAAGVARNAVTWAGLKDRHAVTEQWFGIHLPGKAEPDLSVIESDSIRILQVKRHNKKLRVGYLKGNPAAGWGGTATNNYATANPQITRWNSWTDKWSETVGGTTAVFGHDRQALYFSKEVIPYTGRDYAPDEPTPVFHHVGVYAYRPAALAAYPGWPIGPLETLEGLEQLRFLENGRHVLCVEVESRGREFWELNNPEDVPRIEAMMAEMAAR